MTIYLIVLLAVISRFIPHIPNFAPITALAIFAAANMEWKKATGIVLAVRFISDIFLGFVSWPLMVAIYASHLVGVVFGVWIKRSCSVIPEFRNRQYISEMSGIYNLRSRTSLPRTRDSGMTQSRWFKIGASSLGASVIFFLVTNFAFLYSNYTHNFSGILESYINGLPFLRGTLLGDLSYTAALFGAYELVKYFISKKSSNQYIIPNT